MHGLTLKRPDNFIFFSWSIFLFFIIIISHESGLDEFIASFFYHSQNGWIFRNNFFFEKIIHKGGVIFIMVFYFALLGYLIYLFKEKKKKESQLQIFFILITSILTLLSVNLFKHLTTLPCPWHMLKFGSDRASQGIFTLFSSHYPRSLCFPAGHSSSVFPLVSWYFSRKLLHQEKWGHLIPGLFLGVIYGGAQEMRGAHFLSHDLTTLLLSILISWAVSWAIYRALNYTPHV